jgi:hypothetical protein
LFFFMKQWQPNGAQANGSDDHEIQRVAKFQAF